MPNLFTTSNFTLDFDGVSIENFTKVEGLSSKVNPIMSRSVENKIHVTRWIPGNQEFTNTKMERPADQSKDLWLWYKMVLDGLHTQAYRNGSVVLRDSEHQEVTRWNFRLGLPVAWTGATLDASTNNIAMETIEIAHQGIVKA